MTTHKTRNGLQVLLIEPNIIWQHRLQKWVGQTYHLEITKQVPSVGEISSNLNGGIIILDIDPFPFDACLNFIERINLLDQQIKTIILGTSLDENHLIKIKKSSVYGLLFKNDSLKDALPIQILQACKARDLELENMDLRKQLEQLSSQNPAA